MAVKNTGEIYRCNVCGNDIKVTKIGDGTLVCCGKDMVLISK
jgi:desulfoferrodoxin-like iron-binding protein